MPTFLDVAEGGRKDTGIDYGAVGFLESGKRRGLDY